MTTTHERLINGYTIDNFSISAGSSCGYLFRNWKETSKRWKLLYYVLDFESKQLYECEIDDIGRGLSDNFNITNIRNQYSLHSARLDYYDSDSDDGGDDKGDNEVEKYYTFQIIIRSEKAGQPPKMLLFGALSLNVRTKWLEAFNEIGISVTKSNLPSNHSLGSLTSKSPLPTKSPLNDNASQRSVASPLLKSAANLFPASISKSINAVKTKISSQENIIKKKFMTPTYTRSASDTASGNIGQNDNFSLIDTNSATGRLGRNNRSTSMTLKYNNGASSSSLMELNEDRTIAPLIIVNDKRFRITCNASSTNAWLLSEIIRVCIKSAAEASKSNNDDGKEQGEEDNDAENDNANVSEDDHPNINGLYNYSQKKDLDLSDDVLNCIEADDVIVALVEGKTFQKKDIDTAIKSELQTKKRQFDQSPTASLGANNLAISSDNLASIAKAGTSTGAESANKGAGSTRQASTQRFLDDGTSEAAKKLRVSTTTYQGNQVVEAFESEIIDQHSREKSRRKYRLGSKLFLKYKREILNITEITSNEVPYWLNNEFVLRNISNNVRLYENANKKNSSLVSSTTIEAISALDLLEKLLNTSAQRLWNPLIESCQIIEARKYSDIISISTKYLPFINADGQCLFNSNDNFKVAFPRRIVMERVWFEREDGSFVIVFKSVSQSLVETKHPLEKLFQETGAQISGGYVIQPIISHTSTSMQRSENKATKKFLLHQLYDDSCNLSGLLPGFLQKRILKYMSFTIGGFRDCVQCEEIF